MPLQLFRPVFVHSDTPYSLLDVGHDESFYIMETGKCHKSGLDLLWVFLLSRLNEVMGRLLVTQVKLKCAIFLVLHCD